MGAKQSANIDNIDISSYLTQEQADEIYQVKPPTDDEFVLKTYADDTYKFPEDYVSKNELSAYLLEDKAKRLYQELPPKGDQFVLKSYTDQLNRLTSNYATMAELNKYITQELASSLYQSKDPNGNLTANTIWNRSTDFMLGINDGRGNFSNGMPGGRALVKGDNAELVINFDGDFGGGTRIAGARGLNLVQGPIIANTPGTQSIIQNLNISNGFNAPKANSSLYGVIVGDAGINSSGDILFKNGKSIIIPDSGGGYGAGNGSYIYNDGQTLKIQMRNGADGRIELKTGSKTLSFDMNGKLCFAPGKCITENTPGINWSS